MLSNHARRIQIDEIKKKRSEECKVRCQRKPNHADKRRRVTRLGDSSETLTMQRLKKLNREVLELLRR